jgi:hypothetical protein
MQQRENQANKERYRCRIKCQTFPQPAFKQRYYTALKAATGAINTRQVLAWAS